LEQEEQVHGKKRAYEKLRDEEREILEEMRKTKQEIAKLEEDVRIMQELDEEVNQSEEKRIVHNEV